MCWLFVSVSGCVVCVVARVRERAWVRARGGCGRAGSECKEACARVGERAGLGAGA